MSVDTRTGAVRKTALSAGALPQLNEENMKTNPRYNEDMPTCRECNDEVTKLVTVKAGGKARKVCEDCADRLREAGEVAEASESVIQGMMGYKGRR